MTQQIHKGRILQGRAGIEKLVKKRSPTLFGIKRLLVEINKLTKKVPLEIGSPAQQTRKHAFVKAVYGNRTAEEMANRERILVPSKGGQAKWGCHQQSLVLYETLKELEKKYPKAKLNPRIIRYFVSSGVPHTAVIFEYAGQLYEADPYYGHLGKLNEHQLEGIRTGIIKFAEPKPIKYEDYKKQRETNTL